MPRCLGIDFGKKRVGLAISDPEGIIAQPFGAIEWDDLDELIGHLKAIALEKHVETVVVGHPIYPSGDDSEMSREVGNFAERLRQALSDVKIVLVDERYSSKEAEAAIRETGKKPSRDKAAVDAVAASLILQTYLGRYVR